MGMIQLCGRVLFALIFVGGAFRHFTAEGISHAADLGVPLAWLMVPASGVLAIAGGISILLGIRPRLGVLCVLAFLLPVTLMMHAFWNVSEPGLRHVQLAMFMKNLSMFGAGLLLLSQKNFGPSLDHFLPGGQP